LTDRFGFEKGKERSTDLTDQADTIHLICCIR
jgi:hypothetical protein